MGGIGAVRALLAAVFVLMAGSGVLSALIALRLEADGEPALVIGAVATAYFVGLTVGSIRVSRVIGRVGHIRAFAAFVSVFSASTLAYVLHLNPFLWGALRAIEGFCMAGVFVCLESWMNEKGAPEDRGRNLSFYMIALYTGQAVGQYLLTLGEARPAVPFLAASMLLSLAIIPVALTRQPQPAMFEGGGIDLRRLYEGSPLGVTGALANGLILGGFYGLAAVFCRGAGLSVPQTATFISTVIFGGVLLQWPLGRLSDLIDRRTVIVGVLGAAVVVSLGVAFSAGWPSPLRLAAASLFGGVTFALYPLCVAHTNDRLDASERVAATSGLVLTYSVGAAAGPLAGSAAMALFGPSALFGAFAVMAAATLVFALWRLTARAAVPNAQQQPYLALPRTTPAATSLDPFSDPQSPSS